MIPITLVPEDFLQKWIWEGHYYFRDVIIALSNEGVLIPPSDLEDMDALLVPLKVEMDRREEIRRMKDRARTAATQAVKKGLLEESPCEICGRKVEKHHPDYSRPLDVEWLCKEHHWEKHRNDSKNRHESRKRIVNENGRIFSRIPRLRAGESRLDIF